MKNLNETVSGKMDRLGDMALKGIASAALKVTTVNVRTSCWFVLGQENCLRARKSYAGCKGAAV